MEKIVDSVRVYNIYVLLVIGGFEVRGSFRELTGWGVCGGDSRVFSFRLGFFWKFYVSGSDYRLVKIGGFSRGSVVSVLGGFLFFFEGGIEFK